MQFSAADIAAMISAMGTACTIGVAPAVGVFSAPGMAIEHNGMTLVTTEPTLLLDEVVAATVTNNSTVITIGGVQYESFEKMPDGSGFVLLNLTTDF
jgi:hypothetical protein